MVHAVLAASYAFKKKQDKTVCDHTSRIHVGGKAQLPDSRQKGYILHVPRLSFPNVVAFAPFIILDQLTESFVASVFQIAMSVEFDVAPGLRGLPDGLPRFFP